MSEKKSRNQYSEEYKSEAVRLANDSGKPVTQVARELGVNANVLHRWMREERKAGAAGKTRGAVKVEQEEIVPWIGISKQVRTKKCSPSSPV